MNRRPPVLSAVALFAVTLFAFGLPSRAGAQAPDSTGPPICCGETCSAARPCCDGTVCSADGRCVPEVCGTCGDRGCSVNLMECTGACRPPACCGESCGGGRPCCEGTVCSVEGRCVPRVCRSCGNSGCRVDYTTCSAECAQPDCCRQPCTTSASCCAGTVCRELGGQRQCVPEACAECGGATPQCRVDDSCRAECAPPAECGRACTTSAECGGGLVCFSFSPDRRRCVLPEFESECSRCGSAGCNFSARDCSVTCNL